MKVNSGIGGEWKVSEIGQAKLPGDVGGGTAGGWDSGLLCKAINGAGERSGVHGIGSGVGGNHMGGTDFVQWYNL